MHSKLIYGIHSVHSLIKNKRKITNIYYTNSNHRVNYIISLIKKQGITCNLVSKNWLNKITNHANHQGILAKIYYNYQKNIKDVLNIIKKKALILIIDRIQDPHNLGACLRCAAAAKVDAVILPYRRTAPINEITSKVSCGAIDIIPIIHVVNIKNTIKLLKNSNIWIIGTVCNVSKDVHYIYEINCNKSIALIIGSESNGIKHSIKNKCDQLVNIPMLDQRIQSLNTSVATGICLFEILRQRKFNKT